MKKLLLLLFAAVALKGGMRVSAQSELIPAGAQLDKVADGCEFTEGPAYDRDGSLYFSDGPNQRIMVIRPNEAVAVWKQPSGRANGMRFDAKGRLVTCCAQGTGGARAVVRWEKDGARTVLADQYNGKRLNAPNDLCFDRQGRIYFTDPAYGMRPTDGQEKFAVYRIEAGNGEPIPQRLTRVIDDVDTPNGILLTPDNKTLYLADNSPRPDGPHTLLAYDVLTDGKVKRRKVVYDFGAARGIDGMMLDTQGNIYATAESDDRTGVYIISPQGQLLGVIHTPETATNCMWGGKDFNLLYLTAGRSVYRMKLNTRGWWVWP